MKSIKNLLLLALLPIAFASCDDPEGPVETFDDSYSSNFTFSKDLTSGQEELLQGGNYSMHFDLTGGTIEISVKDLFYTMGAYPLSFNLPAARFTFDQFGEWKAEVDKYTFTANGDTHSVDKFKFTEISRISGNSNYRVIDISFTLDDRYFIRAVQEDVLYFASTTVSAGDKVVYQSTTPYYVVDYDMKKMSADLYIYQAKFMAEQPAMDMCFPATTFTVSDKGTTLSCDQLVPTIKGVPYPNYSITNLKADLDTRGAGKLEFDCTVKNDKIPQPTTFHVAVDLYLLRK